MPLPPSPLLRFAKFARRFAPLWLVWLAILTLPPAREVLTLQLPGSPLAPQVNLIGRENLPPDPRFDPFQIAAKNPADLNARLWRFSQMLDGVGAGFDKFGEQNRRAYRPDELLAEADAIGAAFPREKWLASLPLRALRMNSAVAARPAKIETGAMKTARREWLRRLQIAARAEPNNALYPLLEAGIWRAKHNDGALRAALGRASRCAVLDGHDGQWTRAIVRAHELARPLLLEEKSALWTRENGVLWWQNGVLSPPSLAHQARLAQRAGNHRRAVEIGAAMLQIGDLMQRRPNTLRTAESAREWKTQAWALRYRKLPFFQNYPTRIRRSGTLWARDFSAYAAAHGRPDVVALDKKWRARETQIERLTDYNPRLAPPQAPRDALWWAEFWRNAGILVGAQLLYVAAFWLLVNLILWRGVGAASSSRERVVPALWLALGSAALAGWCWRQVDVLMAIRWTPGLEHLMFAIASVALLAFFGPPFLLALGTATRTLWTRRADFSKPARIDTELRLTRSQSVLLRAGPTILAAAGLCATLGFWLLWLGLIAFDVTTLDPFGWFSASVIGPQPVEWLIAPLLYCLFLDGLGFLLWFNKWRYYAGKESRPLTHGALRGWKESLGIYLVIGSAIYGGVALWSWPARAAANRQVENRLTQGELPR